MLLAPAVPAAAQYSGISIHQRIVIRVPRPEPPGAAPAAVRWREVKGPRCVPLDGIAGAAMVESERMDLLLADGGRLRARFDDACPALDFYRGLYVKANSDGLLCAKRDTVRSRSGDACRIRGFRKLVRRK
ncbi:MAG: hypothetical protein A4S12_06835 [Proteobacteria bacterium SG_bin5]|nr:hypothetical protein [Sphingomonas sp.]OQW42452.1 MAG: hypothetical protein A4S12_06835 [Proteobacteria bacterium SG_bin5]